MSEILTTDRLTLRPWRDDDADLDAYASLSADPEVMRYIGDGTPLTRAQAADGLKRFVDAAHRKGVAVVLDVVYNHLGPEGNYLRDFGPYFSEQYRTPWGDPKNSTWRSWLTLSGPIEPLPRWSRYHATLSVEAARKATPAPA